MRLGIDVSQHQLTWDELLARTRWAEEAGFDGAWVFDHFKALYGDPTGPCLEGWSLLAALGAATERIRLGSMVTGVTYRHPSVLAAQAVTVDHISNGRLEFGIGAAWFDGEHHELGLDFPSNGERIRRLDEAIDVMRLLMTEDGASYDGRYYQLDNASYNPKPAQKPHPPIWVGGHSKAARRRTARLADGWLPIGARPPAVLPPEEIAAGIADVRAEAERAGRDPSSIRICFSTSASFEDDAADKLRRYVEVGVESFIVSFGAHPPDEIERRLRRFAEEVRPAIGAARVP
jgi:probable F420-dependent oxidoreductase